MVSGWSGSRESAGSVAIGSFVWTSERSAEGNAVQQANEQTAETDRTDGQYA
jgi:hypothetical protein